ncbi:penicillin acylase family protein [Shimia marina]|uniref:Acyl-homoserine lactone acylase QuiP n=1 Tax=Shimia marina TaxID=321267 RepID=A0A0P1ESP3_9RHOB|nr:penicillin acylase family protein [Shimia marina]CUH53563.1 Acyl-homoserine lactone acylase QuiP precursor [Shimia marina]SFD74169.1 penicillin amidase [Shimia marina]
MATFFQWLMRIASGLVILVVLAVAMIYFLASRSLPTYDKTFTASGISQPVEIIRNNANVPHIFGNNDEDVFFGLGYAHAQDRLWQMITMRRTVQGRLSEVFGQQTLEIDTLMRRLDLATAARMSVSAQDPDILIALQAYARGVNARIEEVNQEALGRGAPELFLFQQTFAPWQPADSIALQKLMALQLTGHLQSEVLRARTSLALPDADRLRDILPDAPGKGIATLPKYANLVPGTPVFAQSQPLPAHPLSPFTPLPLSGASNAWAAAPSRSAAGGTLLANDPHLGLSAPAIWYLARLELQSGGVIGATIPGIPAILAGRSDQLGWGVTAAYVDDQDIFIEELDASNPESYRTSTGFKPFKTRKSIINIKDAKPVTLTLRWTDNGPVLPGSAFNLAAVTPPGHVASLGWTALSPQDRSTTALMGLMRATDISAALATGKDHTAPGLTLTLADQNDVAMALIGALPRRDAIHQSQGRLPSLGWRPENQWQGLLPATDTPTFEKPSGGILGNTNNKIVERPFPRHISFLWGDSQRIQRWQRLMQNRRVHTRDSFIEAQLDTVSFSARALLPLIAADLWYTSEAAPDGSRARQRQRALALLSEWNGEMNEHMPEPLIYAAWMRSLQSRLIRDDLGPLAEEFTHVEPLFIERVFRDVEGAAAWCDVRQSARMETCSEMAQLALDDALLAIEERYGQQLEALRWGDAHQATHDHPTLGKVPLLRYFVNIRQSTSGGDNTLQRGKTAGVGDNPFLNVHAAGYRGVYDFADPDSSVFVISTGQSGHFLSRFYDDMAQLWRRGEYIPMSLDKELARAAAVGVTIITPTP